MKNKKLIRIVLIIIISIIFSITLVYAENETGEEANSGGTESSSTQTQESTSGKNASGITETSQNTQTQTIPSTTETQKEAVTETDKTTETQKSTQQTTKTTSNNNTTTNTTAQSTAKSSNADLSNLGINPNDFSGFTANKTSYSVSVPNTVKSVEVYAKAKDSKSSITGIGNIELKEGQNTATVTVTAEDGTTKTYTITITKLKEGEKISQSTNNSGISLKKLEIEGHNLEPSFESDKFLYTINYEGEETNLKIVAEANQTSNKVQIIGNENFVDGENIVTIIVSDAKEKNSVVYQITINKNLEKQRALQKEIEDSGREHKIKVWLVRILIFVIIIGVIALIILKHKKSQAKDYYEEDLPKSMRKLKNSKKNTTNKKRRKSKGKHGK